MDWDIMFKPTIKTFICIVNKDKKTIVEIAKETNMIYFTIRKHTKFLEEHNLIKTVPCKNDKRKLYFKVTERGNHLKQLINSILKLVE